MHTINRTVSDCNKSSFISYLFKPQEGIGRVRLWHVAPEVPKKADPIADIIGAFRVASSNVPPCALVDGPIAADQEVELNVALPFRVHVLVLHVPQHLRAIGLAEALWPLRVVDDHVWEAVWGVCHLPGVSSSPLLPAHNNRAIWIKRTLKK